MRLALFIALLCLCIHAEAQVSATDPDALRLIDKVVKHYLDADAVHLEATKVEVSHSALADSKSTELLSAYVASGGRFRYEGSTSSGHGLIVSDGTDEWRLMSSFAQYAKHPAGTYFGASTLSMQGDDQGIVYARNLLADVNFLGPRAKTVHFLKDEAVPYAGRTLLCRVVALSYGQGANSASETTVWVDEANLTILKMEAHSKSTLWYGTRPSPFGPTREFTTTTTFSVIDLNFVPTGDTFAFVPPGDAKAVAELPVAFPATTGPKGLSPNEKLSAEHVGKPLPEITLKNAKLEDVSLKRYAGHPLLIDVWATWCGPCIGELPKIGRIRSSTAKTDLAILGVDEDAQAADAPEFLKRRGFDWDDLHYDKPFQKALPSSGIPLTVLVNASGTIVYYHVGADDAKGLAEAVAKLGEPYRGASAER